MWNYKGSDKRMNEIKCSVGRCKFNNKPYYTKNVFGVCQRTKIRHGLNGCVNYIGKTDKQFEKQAKKEELIQKNQAVEKTRGRKEKMSEKCKLVLGDCLEKMKEIPTKSINLIVADLPYGVTHNKEDKEIDLKSLWKQYCRIKTEKGMIILTSQQPFTNKLMNSNLKMFKYELIWNKGLVTGFLNAKRMPLRQHENILVFYDKLGTYNPQYTIGKPLHSKGINYKNKEIKNQNYGKFSQTNDERKGSRKKYPTSIININKKHPSIQKHPTEKPEELARYLIETYSNKGDFVLDNCFGTGWTAIASIKLQRKFIGIEINKEYFEIAKKRIGEWENQSRLFEI